MCLMDRKKNSIVENYNAFFEEVGAFISRPIFENWLGNKCFYDTTSFNEESAFQHAQWRVFCYQREMIQKALSIDSEFQESISV